MFQCLTKSPEETGRLAELIGSHLLIGMVFCLSGDLGAGKTLFVQHLAKAAGVEGTVASPTFNILNILAGNMDIWHYDLYRLQTEDELSDTGFFEYIDEPDGVAIIEWPDRFWSAMPDNYIEVHIERVAKEESQRRFSFFAKGEKYGSWLEEIKNKCEY